VNQGAIPQKEEKIMATATLEPTLSTPISGLRPATMDRILVIEGDGALRKILWQLFSSEGDNLALAHKQCNFEKGSKRISGKVLP
jgi:hypothetical protein